MLKSELDIIRLIQKDEWMMELLNAVKSLDLPDWWICAGFVRSKVWDTLHGFEARTSLPDIDVIYYDDINMCEEEEKKMEGRLKVLIPNIPWSVKNEARMHIRNSVEAYTSSVDAIAKFPETATALGIKMDSHHNLILSAPHGIQDVINLEVKPTPYFAANEERIKVYANRVIKKNWELTWSQLKVQYIKS